MYRKNILNDIMLRNQRNQVAYQAIITDLTILGYIKREDAEKLLGYEIPSYLHSPDGKSLAKPEAKKEETKPAAAKVTLANKTSKE